MIFNETPWRNEPAHTGLVGSEAEESCRRYNAAVQPLTVRYAMLDWLQNPDMRYGIWQDIIEKHFCYNVEKILSNVEKWGRRNGAITKWTGGLDASGVRRASGMRFGRTVNLAMELETTLKKFHQEVRVSQKST